MAESKRSRFFLIALTFLTAVIFLNGCARAPKKPTYVPPPVTAPQTGFYVTLEKGQTLYRLAKTYGVSVQELMRANRVSNPSQLIVGQQIFIPRQAQLPPPPFIPSGGISPEEARRLVGPFRTDYRWETITVHHSGTRQGSAQNFDKDHKRRHMGGLFYHFVIGNGTKTRDGQVEIGFRWKKQIKANRPYDIQICLVGNFDEQTVSDAQFSTLVNLIRALQETYHIPTSRIRQHCDIPGKHTDCPGKRFPFRRLITSL